MDFYFIIYFCRYCDYSHYLTWHLFQQTCESRCVPLRFQYFDRLSFQNYHY